MSEEYLVLVQALVVDDQVEGELDLAVEDERLEVLGGVGLARGSVLGVEVELILLHSLDRVHMLEKREVLDPTEDILAEDIVLGGGCFDGDVEKGLELLSGDALDPGLTKLVLRCLQKVSVHIPVIHQEEPFQ